MTEKEGLIRLIMLIIKANYAEIPNIVEVIEANYKKFKDKPECFTREMRSTMRMYELILELGND